MKLHFPSAKTAILVFSLICVAVTSAYVLFQGDRLLDVLSGPGWCKTALGAEKASSNEGAVKGLDACVGLLTIQLKSVANNSYILHATVALCLLVLMVIVVAGGRLEFSASKTGVSGKIGKEGDVAKAAVDVANAAEKKADEIKKEVVGDAPPPEEEGKGV